jgi:Calcineurin-like phosphoesterase superfamily domain
MGLSVPVGMLRVLRRPAQLLAAVALCAALALGGLWLGMRLSTPATYGSALGTASFQLRLSSHGAVEVFIPLADWGLRAHPFSAPLTLHVEPRALNRQAVIAAAQGHGDVLKRAEADLTADGRRAIERAARYLLAGVLIAALIGWGVLRSYHWRNRRLLIGVPVGTVLIAVLVTGATIWRVAATWDSDAFTHPTYYARGAELIQLLDAAEHAHNIKDSYAGKVQGALSGFASLLANPSAGAVAGDRRALLISDLHNNTLALSSVSYYAQGQTVFFPGDFGNTGDASETRTLVPAIAKLSSHVIAVSGNHDSHMMMLALARHHVTVLTSHGQLLADGRYGSPEIPVNGLLVAGFEDPFEYHGHNPGNPRRTFSFSELPDAAAATAVTQQRLLAWFRSLPRHPDVVLIHENGLADYLGRALYADGYRRELTILTGHDHIQHVNHYGPIDIVDAGTVGASGLYGIGSDYVGLGELHWDVRQPILSAADLIEVEPVSGVAQAQRVVLPDRCALRHTGCDAAVDYLDPREGPNTTALRGAQPVSPLSPIDTRNIP